VFCQNFHLSQGQKPATGQGMRLERLAWLTLELQDRVCHNINFVTPEHVVPQILEALVAGRGVRPPTADRLQQQRQRLAGEQRFDGRDRRHLHLRLQAVVGG
jgi:hypothetical protein